MFRLFLSLILFVIFQLNTAMAQERRVILELVLAVDTSSSVDEAEFELQRQGLAQAFASQELLSIIEVLGEKGIAVSMIEWAGENEQHVIIDWTLINSVERSLEISKQIASAPRPTKGSTDIGSAIRYAAASIKNNEYEGARKVIDVSGDGLSNKSTSDTQAARDYAISQGITINGLVILQDAFNLSDVTEVNIIQHYSNEVIGGNGAFLMTAVNFSDFKKSILQKLLREILGTTTASLQ